jgi:nicotinamidase-related amidase/type 1 glutamine amidotransferase
MQEKRITTTCPMFRKVYAGFFLLGISFIFDIRSQPIFGQDTIDVVAQRRVPKDKDSAIFNVIQRQESWEPAKTAVIVCDMWDRHWCRGATARVAEVAPRINEFVAQARRRGALIIHAPSGTIGHYKDHSARIRAQSAPKADNLPKDIGRWCSWMDEKEKKVYPIDQADGGCDCTPKCKTAHPWKKQIETIEIKEQDAISDSGAEIWNLLEQRSINNVMLVGVHTNMCVSGRPFGLRNLARNGKNVVLVRDLTDTMYNSQSRPFVNHFTGTDLIVEHIEKYISSTVTSDVLTGKQPFRFAEDKRPRIVFLSAESEYQAADTLPVFANYVAKTCNYHCQILQGSFSRETGDRNAITGMQALENADLLVVFARRRAFPADQMKYLTDYLARGKPLIGLRTASHAFDTKGKHPQGHVEWRDFDPVVLGGNYHGHFGGGKKCEVTPVAEARNHPTLKGVSLPFTSMGSLYKNNPLKPSAIPLLMGKIAGQGPEPVAWTHTYNKSRVFYTSLGYPDDFQNPAFVRLLTNAINWALAK